MQELISKPLPEKLAIVDVREPAELHQSGTIPNAINIPVTSEPDALFLPDDVFAARLGLEKPALDTQMIMFCKAGVRSRTAAVIARAAGYTHVCEYPGSWNDWSARGGSVQKVDAKDNV